MILRSTFAAVVFAVVATTSPLLAADAVYSRDGLALSGYDPVAYFTAGKAEKGSGTFETEWGGTKWRFVSAARTGTHSWPRPRSTPRSTGATAPTPCRGDTRRPPTPKPGELLGTSCT